jgi:TPR repeat protein
MAFSFLDRWFNRALTPSEETAPNSQDLVGAEEQFQRGLEFANGEVVPVNYAQAAHWYAKAAEQHHSLAQLSLAAMYGQGRGLSRDETKSRMWLVRAANLGNAAAQYRVGVQQHLACRDELAEKLTERRIEALKWVRLSAAQGYPGAETACEYVALGMTCKEVAEGGRRATSFVASTGE